MKKKVSLIIVAAIFVIYILGVGVFSFFTYPKTEINKTSIGFTNKKEILSGDYSQYELKLVGKDDTTDTISAKDIDYSVSIPEGTKVEQNAFIWPIAIFRNHEQSIEYNAKWDEGKFKKIFENMKLNKEAIEPEDAKIDRVNDKFEIVKEVEGNKLDSKKLEDSIFKAFLAKEKEIKLEDEYMKPEVLSDSKELEERMELMNRLFNISITFDFEYAKEELLGEDLVAIYDNENGSYKLNEEKAKEYIKKLAAKYDTFGKDHKIKATGLGEVTVPGGIYGWQTDVNKTAELLIKQLNSGKSGTIMPEYKLKGLKRVENGVGDTYIEIDLTRQHLWFYKDGNLIVESDIITGLPTADRETPTGTFKVWSRETNRDLTGEDYSSPVKFWMPINWTGIGMHDASWQSSFGGDLYKTVGSRGCINIPYEKVKAIYENVAIDTPVLVYK